MEKMEPTIPEDDTEHQIQPLGTNEISIVSGGAAGKKPAIIATPQPQRGNAGTAPRSNFYQR
ncbi:hypothetical protein [Achromobacter pestifer]|uniref:Uncharacterized protein n=1 Tax=Achromobacter pestifer TaxID=1353889 RepID=A0A6S6ZSV5_9BURK|nr:hypothetical protein [Achromobacter pestifer]CAB3634832.1 hypothetical protein LMG3431_01430 [Achromobacter pestifer]